MLYPQRTRTRDLFESSTSSPLCIEHSFHDVRAAPLPRLTLPQRPRVAAAAWAQAPMAMMGWLSRMRRWL